MNLQYLRTEYRLNPLGIDVLQPRLSWQLSTVRRGARQTAYQIIASLHEESLLIGDRTLWDTDKIASDQSIHIPYSGPGLQSRQRIYWKVRIWDEKDQASEWSAPAWFEMGLLDRDDWLAQWIGNPLVGGPRSAVPSPFFRKDFSILDEIQSARLYITALGVYEAYLNGQRVGQDIFAPGWTDYFQRVQYQSYDVTDLLTQGANTLGAVLGDGWYCGHVGWETRQLYGDRPKLLAQLEISLADGSRQTVCSDGTWQTAVGPLLEADLIMGEAYDARLEFPGWDRPDFQVTKSWSPVVIFPHPTDLSLTAQNTPSVRAQGEILPIEDAQVVQKWPLDDWIFDFGQNLVGRVRLKIKGKSGTTITLRFGEMLTEKGSLYTENLRSARQTDYYTLRGDPDGEIYESRFTFHGFRFVEVRGLPEKPSRDLLTAIVLHSDNLPSLEFECSDPLLNQLQHNILWGWKGNSVDVPTDCPQRDERLGWTGDAQVFVKTATYLSDAAGFFNKWTRDMAEAQFDYGAIPPIAPCHAALKNSDGGPAWSDAFVIVPWTIWQQYGDTRLLETYYPAMCTYMDYLLENSPGLIRFQPTAQEFKTKDEEAYGGYGDWLAQDGSSDRRGLTPKDLIGTAFLAYDAKLMSQMAETLGKIADAARFRQLFEDTRAAFIRRFVTPDGLLVGQTQTGYLLALHFDLVPEELRPSIIAALLKDIRKRNTHMSTGFVGTPYICRVLTSAGYLDLAYDLLLQKTFPSWLYSVLHGATTIWERWDGWTEEKGFHDPAMNSFNHYAYGAVGTWMYENIAGIQSDPAVPGFKRILLQPRIGGELNFARCQYLSPYGTIQSHWRMEADTMIWEVSVPPNTTAKAHIPSENQDQIWEGAVPLEESPGVKFLDYRDQAAVCELQSGQYSFRVQRG